MPEVTPPPIARTSWENQASPLALLFNYSSLFLPFLNMETLWVPCVELYLAAFKVNMSREAISYNLLNQGSDRVCIIDLPGDGLAQIDTSFIM